MWASATAPGGMPSPGINTAQIRENDPGLVGVAGGMYSIRPRTPTRPKDSDSSLHLRKTATYKNPPQSSIVLTRKASPRVARHVKQRVARKSPMRTTTAGSTGEAVLNSTGTARLPVEHYINIIRDSVHRLGVAAMPLIDQLCFSSRRAQIDGLFRLCPSIDFTDAGKIIAYLQSHTSEIEHLRTLTKGHLAIPADH